MGQSQLFIIAVSVLIIGIGILAATGFFQAGDVDANKKAMVNDINQIAHLAVRYYSRPIGLGGGGHSYSGFVIPTKYRTNLNASYSATAIAPTCLQITGISARDSGNTMTAQIDSYGKASNWAFGGDFE